MKTCYLHLGSNIGDRSIMLNTAIDEIKISIGKVIKKSAIYETEAWGNKNQASFYNMAIKIKTKHKPIDVLNEIHRIETKLGRVRIEHWGPRVIDIDILFYGYDIVDTETLTIPHPLLKDRRFVLTPMMDIAANYVHPIDKKKIKTLYNLCKDNSEVKPINE